MALRCRTNGRNLKDARLLEQIRWELMSKNWTSPLTPLAPPPPAGLTDGKIKELMRLAVNGGLWTTGRGIGKFAQVSTCFIPDFTYSSFNRKLLQKSSEISVIN